MKKVVIIFSIVLMTGWGMLLADFPGVKFVAPMDSVTGPVDGIWTLTVMATESETIEIVVDEATEIEGEMDVVLTPDELAAYPAGTIVKVAGVFMGDAPDTFLYARGVSIVKCDEAEFEFKGPVESVDCASGIIGMLGFEVTLSESVEIRGADGELLTCEDIAPGQILKTEGVVVDSSLVAEKIRVGVPGKEHLVVEFRAVVQEMVDDNNWMVAISNPTALVPVHVVLDENTQVVGDIAVGTEVEITGVLTPELAVLARLIKVRGIKALKNADKGNSAKKGEESGDVEGDDEGDDESSTSGKKDENPGKKDDNPGKKDDAPGQNKDKDKSDKGDDSGDDPEEDTSEEEAD